MTRYLAVLSAERSLAEDDIALLRDTALNNGLVVHQANPRRFLASSPCLPVHCDHTGSALLLGTAYVRDGSSSTSLQVEDSLSAQRGDPAAPLRKLWGSFVMFLPDSYGPGLRIVRSPFGRLGCLYAQHGGRVLVGSDMPTLCLAGLPRPALDVAALTRWIGYRELPAAQTCLAGVRSLLGGVGLAVAEGTQERQLWSPWHVAGHARWHHDEQKACDGVRAAVLRATRMLSAKSCKPLLLLSGGIDSSILAASLATIGGHYACLNLVHRANAGDERTFARTVTRHLGCELLEAEWDLSDIDLTRSHMADQPSPSGRSFMQATQALLARGAAITSADLTLDGGGGDNVFCALQSVTPIVDALRHGSLPIAWRTAGSIALQTETSLLTVLGATMRRLLRRSRTSRWPPDTRFLTPEASDAMPPASDHPWFAAPPGADAGTAAHIAAIAAAQGWAEQGDLASPVRHVTPLAAQPVVEACLAVPTWLWFRDGANRAVARDAFAPRLPAPIIARRTKGTPDAFLAQIYAANRRLLRETLLDGRLAAMGLLDSQALNTFITNPAPVRDTTYLRVLHLGEVEAWLQGSC
ncbi:asparagine synthase-related protein [Novosphingobium sp. M1R2S20]|uniref:asparagine synthase (glutamine-hydrolyzing) n=1 Tax=Novosphingobium rhizovicinum TaxID=3228928 RepID=A0ABV3RFD2_9SPHN